MTLQTKLQNVSDDHRSKQLDLREEALVERERLLDDTSRIAQLDILDKQIEERTRQRDTVISLIDKLKQRLSDLNDRIDSKIQRFREEEEDIKKDILSLKQAKKNVDVSIASSKSDLQTIYDDVSVQKAYLKEQEEKAEQVINDWNLQLREFADADKEISDQKSALERDIISLTNQQTLLERTVTDIEFKNNELESAYEIKAGEYKRDLRELRAQIQKGNQELQEIGIKCSLRMEGIANKEKSLEIREQSIQTKEFDITSREKSLTMRLGLSGMSLE